ncbi:hypothetical protein AWC26_15825 [Mycobacterium shimoidei]|nr:hypothetical protein BHQ16_02410 [Mycobacterium shimoidei]ORW79086.1 hypothetical protein AWC26_15825 [Mycobacterium shimoidei]
MICAHQQVLTDVRAELWKFRQLISDGGQSARHHRFLANYLAFGCLLTLDKGALTQVIISQYIEPED